MTNADAIAKVLAVLAASGYVARPEHINEAEGRVARYGQFDVRITDGRVRFAVVYQPATRGWQAVDTQAVAAISAISPR
jgi:hypothetical protein